jgi:LysR family nitrogen assimilation transcriptional regulator
MDGNAAMDLRQLTAVITVAEVGSVTRAAEVLYLAQPAVTRQIRMLEDELGVQLFERTRQGMRLTTAGSVVAEHARRALRELQLARAAVRPDDDAAVAGMVTIGLLESSLYLLAPRLMTGVGARFPDIDLRVVTAYSGHLQQWLDAGEVDLSLLYNLSATPSVHVIPLVEEQLWAVAPPAEGLSEDTPVTWAELAGHPLVLPVPGHGLRALIDKASPALAQALDISVETNSLLLQKLFVSDGHGWTVLPASGVVREIGDGTLTGAPLSEPEINRQIVLGLPRAKRPGAAVEAVAAVVVQTVRSLLNHGAWPSGRPPIDAD